MRGKQIFKKTKSFRTIFGIDRLWLDFGSNSNRMKKENTDDLYYIKFHTHWFVCCS